jgi:hypothetical protein
MLIVDVVFSIITLVAYYDIGRKKRSMKDCDLNGLFKEESIDCLKKLYNNLPEKEAEKDVLLAEYHRTQDMLRHYDNLNWHIASILVGSNIVALGLISSSSSPNVLFAAAFGGSSSLLAFNLWFFRHVSIYNVKNDRLYIIEYQLKMAQHRMVGYASSRNLLVRVPGRCVALLLYFGLLIAWLIVLI